MKSQELSEFFSLIGQAKKEKEEEFDNLLKEANVDLDSMATSLFTGIENAKVEVKEQKKKEEKLIESLDSLLVSLDKPKETTPIVVGVPEDFDISSLEEEVEEEIIEEEVVEEETVEEDDTISKAIKFIDTQLKEELKDIEPNDPTVDSIKAEVKELRNILYKVLAHGPGSGEVRVLKMDDVDTDDLADGRVLSYDSSSEKLKFVDQSGGGGAGYANTAGISTYAITAGIATNSTQLNGQAASYYLDYDNFTNTPTIPTNNNQLTNGAGYITTSFTNTNQLVNGAGFITTSFTNTNQLVNGAGFITNSVTGNFTVSGNVSIGGTLTYEDVTNIDSVGLITARNGINVSSNGINVTGVSTFQSNVHFGDNNQIILGDGPDLKIYHDGSNSYVEDTGVGALIMKGSTIRFRSTTNENIISASQNGAVDLYYDNSKKFETTSTGAQLTGDLSISDKIVHTGDTNTAIRFPADNTISADTGGAERIRITSDGKIGIGIQSPAYDLDLGESASTIRLVSEDDGTAIRMGAGGSGNDITLIRVDGGGGSFHGESDSAKFGFSLKYLGSGSGNANALSIFSDNQSGTQVEAVTVFQDGTVGINSTSPSERLDVGGTIKTEQLNVSGNATVSGDLSISNGAFSSATATTTTTSQTAVDTFAAATYRSVKYQIQITRGSEYHITEVFIVHDGTTSYGTEYATIKTGSSLASFDTDIDSGNVRLLATPTSSSSTVFKLVKTLIKV